MTIHEREAIGFGVVMAVAVAAMIAALVMMSLKFRSTSELPKDQTEKLARTSLKCYLLSIAFSFGAGLFEVGVSLFIFLSPIGLLILSPTARLEPLEAWLLARAVLLLGIWCGFRSYFSSTVPRTRIVRCATGISLLALLGIIVFSVLLLPAF